MVSFGRSGNSPESLATTELADELVDDIWHLILTCDTDGQLGRKHSDRATRGSSTCPSAPMTPASP